MISNLLADFSTKSNFDNNSDEPLHVLKLSFLDWCSVAIAGSEEPVSNIVRNQSFDEGGHQQCFVFGAKEKLPPRAAALVNGTTSHALDYDDTHFHHVGHTSVVIFSAALAIAELEGVSGRRFLEASLLGSETACRIGHWLGSSHYNKGFHQTATAGTFGAALAAANLLQLNPEQSAHALGIASTKAAGLKCQFGSMGKPYNAGLAAASGVESALLARAGFESRVDALDCAQGFADTHFANPKRTEQSFMGMGETYVFCEVQHKFHACCHGLHATLEALNLIRNKTDLVADDILKVSIEVNPRWLSVCDKKSPLTGLEAKFSYAQVCAMTIFGYDTAALTTYSDEICNKPELVDFRTHVETVGNSDLPDTASRVEVRLKGGELLQAEYDLSEQLPVQEREVKVREKAAVLLGETPADFLWQKIQQFETVDVRDFVGDLRSLV